MNDGHDITDQDMLALINGEIQPTDARHMEIAEAILSDDTLFERYLSEAEEVKEENPLTDVQIISCLSQIKSEIAQRERMQLKPRFTLVLNLIAACLVIGSGLVSYFFSSTNQELYESASAMAKQSIAVATTSLDESHAQLRRASAGPSRDYVVNYFETANDLLSRFAALESSRLKLEFEKAATPRDQIQLVGINWDRNRDEGQRLILLVRENSTGKVSSAIVDAHDWEWAPLVKIVADDDRPWISISNARFSAFPDNEELACMVRYHSALENRNLGNELLKLSLRLCSSNSEGYAISGQQRDSLKIETSTAASLISISRTIGSSDVQFWLNKDRLALSGDLLLVESKDDTKTLNVDAYRNESKLRWAQLLVTPTTRHTISDQKIEFKLRDETPLELNKVMRLSALFRYIRHSDNTLFETLKRQSELVQAEKVSTPSTLVWSVQ